MGSIAEQLAEITAQAEKWTSELITEREELSNKIEALAKADSPQAKVERIRLEKEKEQIENKLIELRLIASRLPIPASESTGVNSWNEWVDYVQSEAARNEVGREAGLLRLAAQEAKKRLGVYHTFCDGSIAQPLLSAETVDWVEDDD